MEKVVEFKSKAAKAEQPWSDGQASEQAVIIGTLENVLTMQGHQEKQISTLIALIGEMQSRISDLEHKVGRIKKADDKKPVILNSHGSRAN